MKRLTRTIIVLLQAALLTATFTACNNNNDEPKPDNPKVPSGQRFDIPAQGGSVETGTLTMVISSGTFGAETPVYVQKCDTPDAVAEVACSDFFEVTLGRSMNKEIVISISGEPVDDPHIVVQTDGWRRSVGGSDNLDLSLTPTTVPLATTYADGRYTARLPLMQCDDGFMPTLKVGLVDCPHDTGKGTTGTRAETRGSKFVINWYYHWSLEDRKIVHTIRNYVEEAVTIIENLGFKLPEGVVVPMVIQKDVDGWGVCNISGWGKSFTVVQLNESRFKKINTATEQEIWQLQQTLVHEMLHFYTAYTYDPRWAFTIVTEGNNGDEWTMLEEAAATWIEKFTGDRRISENSVFFSKDFMREFFPKNMDRLTSMNNGYGMALVLEYLSKRHGDKSILRFFELKRDGKAKTLRECFDLYLKEYDDKLFDIDSYNDFVSEVLFKKIDPRVNMPYLSELPIIRIDDDSPVTFTNKCHPLGILVKDVILSTKYEDASGRSISITQQNGKLLSEVYIIDSKDQDPRYVGTTSGGRSLVVDKDANEFKAAGKLYIVTRSLNDNDDEDCTLDVRLSDPLPTLSVSPQELEFPGNGGTQTATVETNVQSVNVSTTSAWLDATYDSLNKAITVKATANDKDAEREGYVIARVTNSVGNEERTIHVTQKGKKKKTYAAGIVVVKLNNDDSLTIPSLGGRAAAGTATVRDDGTFTFTSTGKDSTEPTYLNLFEIGWHLTISTSSTWRITINGEMKGSKLVLSGSASQTFVSETIKHSIATGDYLDTQRSTSVMSFPFSNVAEPAILTTGMNDTCPYWFSYDAWRAGGATLTEFSTYVQNFRWVDTSADGVVTEKPLSFFGGKNLTITVGLWEDDHINIPAGRSE